MHELLGADLEVHLSRMYRVALRIVGNADEAQDVAQEACLKALRGMETFENRSALATWLHRITVRCAIDHLRVRQRKVGTEVSVDHELAGIAGAISTTPAMLAERRELFGQAVALLEQLPGDCRRAFTLTQLDGYSYDQAAAIEEQPRGTIASRVYRAKQLLLERMSGHVDERTGS